MLLVSTDKQHQLRGPSSQEQLSVGKIISDEEKAKQYTCISALPNSLKQIIEVAKVKTQLKFDAFRATQPKTLPIPTPRIEKIDEGSPMQTYDR
ncbi:unnamed protein product [Lactuca virosa]|uniref:Uncharacterized protein n=1 Tax=Lactuca virosa TaxID=75947 RepID=A0AAU9PVX8_9ASTR|nr:unnamed protein product [Lactuca virosa]